MEREGGKVPTPTPSQGKPVEADQGQTHHHAVGWPDDAALDKQRLGRDVERLCRRITLLSRLQAALLWQPRGDAAGRSGGE